MAFSSAAKISWARRRLHRPVRGPEDLQGSFAEVCRRIGSPEQRLVVVNAVEKPRAFGPRWLRPRLADGQPRTYTSGMKEAGKRLFAPGTGAFPPALTGRKQEQEVLSLCLSDLMGGGSPPHDLVLIGPRGNGKTVLLNWFEDSCRRVPVNVVRVAPSEVRTGQALCNALLPPTRLRRLLPAKWGITGMGKAEWEASSPSAHGLVDRLIARCRRKPIAALVDEAHTLAPEVGQVLLNASQTVRPRAPFMLVLAGTPGLLAHLGKMNASFWDRLGSGLLGIGRLSDAAATEALEKPLAEQGVSIDADALNSVVEQSQCYAYFVQVWGEALWSQRLATGETQLTAIHAAAARPAVEARMTEYYQRRYRELEADGLLPAAAAVAPLFEADMDATATDQDIDAALAATGMDAARRLAAREALNGLGYIWCPPGQLRPVVWSAGIPSLMQYVQEQAAPAAVV